MDPSWGPIARAPSAAFKFFHFYKWRKARRRAIEQFICEALQQALFPHAHESREAQYAAIALWNVLQRTTVPGEVPPRGMSQAGSARIEKLIFGRFPRFAISGVGLKQRIAQWITKAVDSEDGREVLDSIEADLETFSRLDAKSIGAVAAEIFMQRLEVDRSRDPDIERVRLWLREEIRKSDVSALTVTRRVETEVTRAVEASSALAAGGTVSFLLDNVGVHRIPAIVAGYVTAMAIFFGSRILLRRRPLLPRQIGFRLAALEVLCHYLEQMLRIPIVRTVPNAQSALQHVYAFRVLDRSTEPSDDLVSVSRGSPRLLEDGYLLGEVVEDGSRNEQILAEFRAAIQRLNDLAGSVSDPLVQAALMRLEAATITANEPEDALTEVMRVLDALSR